MSYYVVDVEADGPVPGEYKYSMISIGIVKVTPELDTTFYGQLIPISDKFVPEALAVSGFTRKDTYDRSLGFLPPVEVMPKVEEFVKSTTKGRPIFISDNLAFDWMFTAWYLHTYTLNGNVFGYSGRRIGDLYCGMVKDSFAQWKHLRKTKHTHNPVDDAKGNAEALLALQGMGLKINLL